jgi:hypothetical protein
MLEIVMVFSSVTLFLATKERFRWSEKFGDIEPI